MNNETKLLPNSFESVLRSQRRGAFLTDLSQAVQQAVLAVKELGESATITIALKLDPATGDASAISVRDSIKLKLPEAKKPNTLFYSTDDGRLVRDDPNQQALDLRVAESPNSEPIKILETAVNQ